MGAAEIVVTVVTAVACLGMGVFLGSLPFKRDELTEWHMKYQQLGGVLWHRGSQSRLSQWVWR